MSSLQNQPQQVESDTTPVALPVNIQGSYEERVAFFSSLSERSAIDPTFRERFLGEPTDALQALAQEELGYAFEIEDGGRVIALEESIETLHLLLPESGSARGDSLRMGFLTPLIRMASSDAEFRAELLADPTGTVRRHLEDAGIQMPSFISVQVTEISDRDLAVILPPAVDLRGHNAAAVTGISFSQIEGSYSLFCDTRRECTGNETIVCETCNANCPYYTTQPNPCR